MKIVLTLKILIIAISRNTQDKAIYLILFVK